MTTAPLRYRMTARVEKNGLDMPQEFYFIYDLKRGDRYPEPLAKFYYEPEAKLCLDHLNAKRKITKRKYAEKRIPHAL